MRSIRMIALLCTACLVALMLVPGAVGDATEYEGGEISVINYNVAGLPDWGALVGNSTKDVPAAQQQIGVLLNEQDYDIIAVQEDFNYHKSLANELTDFPYTTQHSGGVPIGDGMNLYSKFPLFNEVRIPWEDSFGVISNGADEMTPKGILYALIELAEGVYLDFYDIHADAYDDEGSRQARQSNFRQLAELINANSNDRPVIVTGDFNTYAHLDAESNSNMCYYLFEIAGLKDAWTEVCNNSDYTDYGAWESTGGSWGNWDSVEMILYKSGGGIDLEAADFAYQVFADENGENLSDHAAATAKLTYTKTDTFTENAQALYTPKASFMETIWKAVKACFRDIWKILTNLDELFEFF